MSGLGVATFSKSRFARYYQDKPTSGWLVWDTTADFFLSPDKKKSTFQPWESASLDAVNAIKNVVKRREYWERLATHYAEENNNDTVTQDNIAAVKSICTTRMLRRSTLTLCSPITG